MINTPKRPIPPGSIRRRIAACAARYSGERRLRILPERNQQVAHLQTGQKRALVRLPGEREPRLFTRAAQGAEIDVRGQILLADVREGIVAHGVTAMRADGPCQAVALGTAQPPGSRSR